MDVVSGWGPKGGREVLGRGQVEFEGVCVQLWGDLGRFWGHLGQLWGDVGQLWGDLGGFGGGDGAQLGWWGGGSQCIKEWGVLLWGRTEFEGICPQLWGDLGPFWGHLG